LLIIMMMVSGLSALSSPAAAQDTGDPTPAGAEVPAEQTTEAPVEQPAEDPNAVPTEDPNQPPVEEPVEQATEEQVDNTQQSLAVDDSSSISVSYRVCPAGTDIASVDPATLAAQCTGQQNGVPFDLRPAQGGIFVWNTGDAGQSSVQFTDVPTGAATLYGGSPPAAVFCQGNTSQGNTKPYARVTSSTQQQFQAINLDVLAGEQISCDWYVVGTGTGGSGTVIIRKSACPAGYDASAHDMFDMAATCHESVGAVYFSVFEAGGGYDGGSKLTSGGALNSVTFENVPNVPLWISEVVPDGYGDPVAFCGVEDFLGNDVVPTRYYPWNDGKIELDAPGEENVVQCDWYNIPTGKVIVRKAACPVGYAVSNPPDMYDMAANCHENAGVVNFSVFEAGGGYDGGVKPTSGGVPNSVTFENVPNVPLWINEEIPAGYGDPVVFCQVETELGEDVTPTTYYPWNAGKIELDAPGSGNVAHCDWYNIPTGGDNSVTVYKWQCVDGTEHGQSLDYYQGDGQAMGPCESEHRNIPISLIDGAPDSPNDTITQANGTQFDDVVLDQNGSFQITIDEPDGYGNPMVFCGTLDQDQQQPVTATGSTITLTPATPAFTYQCNWYNIPQGHGTVTIYKWECPRGMEIEQTLPAHQSSCTQPMDDVTFTLTDSKGPRAKVTFGGVVEWADVRIEPITVAEEIPFGYSTQPYVSCDFESQNLLTLTDDVINGVLTATLNHPGQKIVCHWFNQYLGPGDLTIHKWTCPEGYDPAAWNADPKTDCTEATNGVTFVLDQPADADLQSNTGDSINGAVTFGGLAPGDYVVNEIVPEGIAEVFVLDCVGLYTGSVHPVPLSSGPTLQIRIAGGDRIECHWYNVPAMNPDYGWMTVTKHTCSTVTYVSDIDCEIFEDGQAFDLLVWNGDDWVDAASGTTDAAGQLTWTNLQPGTYRVDEQNGEPCHGTSNLTDSDGNLVVQQDTGTEVKVYNCGSTPPVPGAKMPTKYPNTGVEPSGSSNQTTPAASLLGALGLLGTATVSRRAFLRRSLIATAVVGSGSIAVATGLANQPILRIGTPAGTPGPDCLYPATPSATPGTPDANGTPTACARGAVPVHITIPVIEVDAGIEVLEIIGGAMQQPTNAEEIAWYKESARLGEQGNILLAGHLNFWGVPEGVFFLLGQLREGDAVELEGDDGEMYRYIVQWTEDFPSDEEPPTEALGHTDEQAITLITCGGEWNIGRAEYDHRTLVRAVRDTEALAGTPVATPGS